RYWIAMSQKERGDRRRRQALSEHLSTALCEARLARGIDLYEVQRITKIRIQDLRAMEEGRWEEIPTEEAEGLRDRYARFLGVELKTMLEHYTPPAGSERPSWQPRAVIALVAFAAIVGVIVGLAATGGGGGSATSAPPETTTIATPNRSPVT